MFFWLSFSTSATFVFGWTLSTSAPFVMRLFLAGLFGFYSVCFGWDFRLLTATFVLVGFFQLLQRLFLDGVFRFCSVCFGRALSTFAAFVGFLDFCSVCFGLDWTLRLLQCLFGWARLLQCLLGRTSFSM